MSDVNVSLNGLESTTVVAGVSVSALDGSLKLVSLYPFDEPTNIYEIANNNGGDFPTSFHQFSISLWCCNTVNILAPFGFSNPTISMNFQPSKATVLFKDQAGDVLFSGTFHNHGAILNQYQIVFSVDTVAKTYTFFGNSDVWTPDVAFGASGNIYNPSPTIVNFSSVPQSTKDQYPIAAAGFVELRISNNVSYDWTRNLSYEGVFGQNDQLGISATDLSTQQVVAVPSTESMFSGTPYGNPVGHSPADMGTLIGGNGTSLYVDMYDSLFGTHYFVRIDPDTWKVTGQLIHTWNAPWAPGPMYLNKINTAPLECILAYPGGQTSGVHLFDGDAMSFIAVAIPTAPFYGSVNKILIPGQQRTGSCDFWFLTWPEVNIDVGTSIYVYKITVSGATPRSVAWSQTATIAGTAIVPGVTSISVNRGEYDQAHDCLILWVSEFLGDSNIASVQFDGTINWIYTGPNSDVGNKGQSLLLGNTLGFESTLTQVTILDTTTGQVILTSSISFLDSSWYAAYNSQTGIIYFHALAVSYVSVNPNIGRNWLIASDLTQEADGGVGDVWMDNSYIDFSDPSTRAGFVNADGSWQYVGYYGQLPLNRSPRLYLTVQPGNLPTGFLVGYGQTGHQTSWFVYTIGINPITGAAYAAMSFDICPPPILNTLNLTDIEVTATSQIIPDNQVTLRWSDDAGASWSNGLLKSLGQAGEYFTAPSWYRLGMSRNRILELSWSGARAEALQGVFVQVTISAT